MPKLTVLRRGRWSVFLVGSAIPAVHEIPVLCPAGMRRRAFLTAVILFTLLILLGTDAMGMDGIKRKTGEKYNVVLITVNSFRYGQAGFNGYTKPTTPAMDSLAAGSFVFKEAFSQSGYTMPAMMSMFTSLYPETHNVMDAYKDRLSANVITLAEILRENGYITAGFWMTGHPHLDPEAGFGRGFSLVGDLQEDFQGRKDLLDWLERRKNKPFFLAVNLRKTHFPLFPESKYKEAFKRGQRGRIIDDKDEFQRIMYGRVLHELTTPGSVLYQVFDPEQVKAEQELFDGIFRQGKLGRLESLIPKEFNQHLGMLHSLEYTSRIDTDDPQNLMYLRSLYDACILATDQEMIKPILEMIRNRGVWDNTIVILTADHGAGLEEHSNVMGPGTRYYEELIHIPLVIRVPWSSERKEVKGLVQTVDLMPSILELVGLQVPQQAQGSSFVPHLNAQGVNLKEKPVIGSNRRWAFIRTREWKLLAWREQINLNRSEIDELYNILTDPDEKTNLREEREEVYQNLRRRLREYLESASRYIDEVYTYPDDIVEDVRKRIRETGYW